MGTVNIEAFFENLFDVLPPEDPMWKIYTQNAFKMAIRFTNTGTSPRKMPEYRNGNNGQIEVRDDGTLKEIGPGETIWITIEPSAKKYKYDGTKHWVAAAYPQKPAKAKKVWEPITNPQTVREIHTTLKQRGMAIPYFQIASTLKSLGLLETHRLPLQTCVRNLRQGLDEGRIDMGFPGIIQLFKPLSVSIGYRLTQKEQIDRIGAYFPTIYARVPFVKGMLVLLKLNINSWKRGKVTLDKADNVYKFNGVESHRPYLIYPIDAPAVKAALWRDNAKESVMHRDTIVKLLKKARSTM
jgi:hypothetical protein